MPGDYDLMRLSDEADSEGVSVEDVNEKAENGAVKIGKVTRVLKSSVATAEKAARRKEKEKYFEYYDDVKLTPRDDW